MDTYSLRCHTAGSVKLRLTFDVRPAAVLLNLQLSSAKVIAPICTNRPCCSAHPPSHGPVLALPFRFARIRNCAGLIQSRSCPGSTPPILASQSPFDDIVILAENKEAARGALCGRFRTRTKARHRNSPMSVSVAPFASTCER
jgi:hypothetical protein